MLKFIILCIFTLTQSASEFNFTKIYSYQYIEIDLDKNDVFYEYEEKSNEIKFEIFEPKLNKQLYTIYQYKKKTDVRYDEITKQYTNYFEFGSYDNLEKFYKKANFFVMTKNAPPTKYNLNYKATIKKYISFMPENPIYKIDTTQSIKELNILKEFNNIYVDILVDPVYNYLSVYSEGNDILYSVNGMNECNNRQCNFEIKQSNNKNTYELRIVNLDLKKKITRKKIYYLLYINPNQPIEYYDKNFVKMFYFENINYEYILNNTVYYDDYINLKEGSIVYYTYPDIINSIDMYSDLISVKSTPQFWYKEGNKFYYIMYFLPKNKNINAKLLDFKLIYYQYNLIGDISVIAVKPTQIINYPKDYKYSSSKEKYTPLILRIVFADSFDDNVILKFSSNTQCINSTIFENDQFNKPIDCSTKKIDSSYKGKKITVIFKGEIQMATLKELNFIDLTQYELKQFSFNNQVKEISFQYDIKSISKIYIHFLNPDSNYKYYIYINKEIKYNPYKKEYLNHQGSGDLKKTISFTPTYKEKLKLIIQCKLNECLYNDYISIREGNIKINENIPHTFNQFKDLSYVVFEFNPKKYLKYKIETNTKSGGYKQSLVNDIENNNINYNECIDTFCLFQFEGNTPKYLIVISNIQEKKNSEISKVMYILFNEDKYEFEMENKFSISPYFITSFKYTFQITKADIIKNFKNVEEGGFVLKTSPNSFERYGIKVTFLTNSTTIIITKKSTDTNFEYYYYYINIKSLDNLIFKVSGSFSFDIPSNISFAYISPTSIINFPTNTKIYDSSSVGIPVYVRLVRNELNAKNEYIIGVEKSAEFTKGKIIKDDGSDLNVFTSVTQYKLSKDYPYNIYTFRFNKNPKIVFGTINGDYYYCDKREYKTFDFNFQKNENRFYIGLYNTNQPITCSYLDGNEKNLVNIYYMALNRKLDYLVNEFKVETNFLCLDNLFDIIRFNSSYELNTHLTIFDPRLDKEKLINTNNKFYLPSTISKKSLYFDKNDINYNNFRVILKEYTKNRITLKYSNNKQYEFKDTNNFTFILQYKKTESENYELKSNEQSMFLIKVLEGKVYEEIVLQKNESTISLNNNSVSFELLYGNNFTSYTITVSNFENSFYHKVYETNETDFGKLIIPQLNPPYNYVEYKNSKTIDLKINNPYFDEKSDNQKYIFVMSYAHNFENDIVQKFKYNLKLIYNPIQNIDYERLNESSINIISQKNFSSNYSIGYGKDQSFLMILSSFSEGKLDFDFLFSSNNYKNNYKLEQRYFQFTKSKLFKEFIYVLSISSKNNIKGKYTCVEISYLYGKDNKKDFQQYNDKNKVKIEVDSKGIIKFDKINGNQITYEIYVTNSIKNYTNLFENDCFLLEKKKQIKNNETINEGSILLYEIKTNTNTYKLSNITGKILINVVAIDNEYHMRIVYKSVQISLGGIGWIIFVIAAIIIVLIAIIAFLYLRNKKKEYSDYAFMKTIFGLKLE